VEPQEAVELHFKNVPAEYDHETMVELHEAFGLDPDTLEATSILPGPGKGAQSCEAVLRYADARSAEAARAALAAQPVATRTGETMHLSIRPVDPAAAQPQQQQQQKKKPGKSGGGGKGGCGGGGGAWEEEDTGQAAQATAPAAPVKVEGPEYIFPSVYVSDVPVEYTEDTIRELHEACSLDPDTVMAVKFLKPTGVSFEATACIVRYADDASAQVAIQVLQGQPVQMPSGAVKHLGARPAKPAQWMLERALQEPGPPPGQAAKGKGQGKSPAAKETSVCAEGLKCIGRAGMLLFSDTISGAAFCEACWDRHEAKHGPFSWGA